MIIWNVVFVWTKTDSGTTSTKATQKAYTNHEACSKEEAIGKFFTDDFKNHFGWSLHVWSCNEINLADNK